jgi:hypothetical protein
VVAGIFSCDFPVVGHLSVVSGFSRKSFNLTGIFAAQSLSHCCGIGSAADDFGPEGVGDREEMVFNESLGLVDVGECFSSILDVRSQECGVLIDVSHSFLTVEVILGGVSIAEVVVL